MKLINRLLGYSLLLALVTFVATSANAQKDKTKRKSPPMEAAAMVGEANIMINYSAPSVRGRTIFGDLEPFGEVWRTGANEATTFEISKNVLIEGEELAAGKYGLFTIPGEDSWTIIFNSVWDQWGDYNYDSGKDVLRVEVPVHPLDENVEQMKFVIKEKDGSSMVALKWAKTKVAFAIAPSSNN